MVPDTLPDGQLKIVVLAGGDSAEREVSLESGTCVAAALRHRRHQVLEFDPAILALHEIPRTTDVILPMLHGTGGEDGTLQRDLDRLRIPWLGSSAEASALTFDKVATRAVLAQAGLPVAPGHAVRLAASRESIRSTSCRIGYPQVVKPAAQGSSVGITIVDSEEEIDAAFALAARWGDTVLIEEYISGREVTVPVIDGEVFPVVEILPAARWYDYAAKYNDDRTRYDVKPSNLPGDLNDIVLRACKVCGVTGISRTDFRIDADGHPWILEINTIPGMTSHSLVPMSIRGTEKLLASFVNDCCFNVSASDRLHRQASIDHTRAQSRGTTRSRFEIVGLTLYRYPGQRHTTVMMRVSPGFVDETLWPEFLELSYVLQEYLTPITERVITVITESIFF